MTDFVFRPFGRPSVERIMFSGVEPIVEVGCNRDEFTRTHIEKWKQLNRTNKKAFETTGEPVVVVNFIKEYPPAIEETWVSKVVARWLMTGRNDLIESITKLGRGENANSYQRDLEKMIIFDRIEEVKQSQNVTLTSAFQVVSEQESPVFKNNLSFTRIKNIYYEMQKFRFKTVIREEPEFYIWYTFPSKIEVEAVGPVYGVSEWKIPK